jgi:hypothetical protein
MLYFVSERLARRQHGSVARPGTLLALLVLLGGSCSDRSTGISLPIDEVVVDAGSGGFFIKLDAHFGQTIPGAYDGGACSGTVETCNGVDDDCDGVIDNGFDL